MSRRISISAPLSLLWPSVICAFLLTLALTGLPWGASAADKLVLQLHRAAQFEFAGYYAALWQGFYRAAGLEVEIRPGAPTGAPPIHPVQEITEGRAQFGTGTVQLLTRASEGQSLLLLAPIFQQSDTRVYYRADDDFASPGALLNGRVGRLPPRNLLELELRTALYAEAIDPDKPRSLSSELGQALADLTSHRVDAAVGSVWELPWQAQERGVALKSFNPAAYRVEYYGDSLFTLQRLAKTDPAMVQRFREASVKGWEYALQHPEEIAARILTELPIRVAVSDPAGFTRYQTEVARKLARYPDVPLGHSNSERWGRIQQSLIEIGEITQPADLDAFLYNPDAAVRTRGNWAVTIVTVAAALLAGVGFLWRWRRRNATPATAADNLQSPFARLRGAASEAMNRLASQTHRITVSSRSNVSRPRPTDLNTALTTLDRSIRLRVPSSVNCRLSLLPELWLCYTDSDAIAATTLDLVATAVADMPAGGDLIVGTRQYAIDDAVAAGLPGSAAGDYVRLTVKDNGPGLSQERLDRIFDPAATSRPAVVAAEELARRLGGFARVESAEGIGTAVHLYFRRAAITSERAQQTPDDQQTKAAAA
jgi:ABC-type nitrate/sulfonate/bicarbonate transport system substrate-binding protein